MTFAIATPEILPGVPRVELSYESYRHYAEDSDILAWEPRDQIGRFIAAGTGGRFSHVSMVVHLHGRPWQYAYRERMNGFGTPLSAEVHRNSGFIAVFRLRDEVGHALSLENRQRIAAAMMNSLGGDYAWGDCETDGLEALMAHLPLLTRLIGIVPFANRWYRQRVTEHRCRVEASSRRKTSADCSHAVARACWNGARLMLCTQKQLAAVTPNDIAGSPLVEYLGHLTWPKTWDNEKKNPGTANAN